MSQIWTGYNDVTNVTGISYENAKHRESCIGPLTTAKLTHSCADPNPGAITYTQATTDMALAVNERCKTLVLKHHKYYKMRTSKAPNAGGHVKISGKAARDLSRGSLVIPARWGLPPTGHPGFFFCKAILLGRGDPKCTGKNGFTNFSEISYGKTRGSYDRSEIAARKQKCILAHQSDLPIEHAAKGSDRMPAMLYSRCNSTHFHTRMGEMP